jgi:hypothetical protein
MDGVGNLAGWSWIVSVPPIEAAASDRSKFIMEGILTFIVGCISPWMVHDWPDQARFLTPLEKEMVLSRLKSDSGLASEGKFDKSVVFGALREWKVRRSSHSDDALTCIQDLGFGFDVHWCRRANLQSSESARRLEAIQLTLLVALHAHHHCSTWPVLHPSITFAQYPS